MSKEEIMPKGSSAITVLWYIGILFIGEKLIQSAIWVFKLVKNWELPEQEFMSKIDLLGNGVELSLNAYLVFGILYFITYLFLGLGIVQMAKPIDMMSKNKLFFQSVSKNFRKAGSSFLIFVIGTFVVDIALLAVTRGSSPAIALFSTETILFVIVGYLMFFLADILSEASLIREENALTI